ncbi:Ribulose bisphosphate carboxylase/oxygenase activase [Helianthus annuus]|nr:Ribulose bisphosphate carboxylase/oxygenase activase [Helianthus annuus]KAJ0487376.1 Ribulose bisphosphate carboxylase/oxygenase activase [Helianthus annuus]KAJ0657818.1 Ribulose bisphosphate carboxylase/oxygenase activase [Helianthus annuus]KAJ0661486.1 Ribulose bisphosphate carboxylase/oxygenase activase [Helianthus annuus]
MATAVSTFGATVNRTPLSSGVAAVPNSSFLGSNLKKIVNSRLVNNNKFSPSKILAAEKEIEETQQTDKDRWRGLAYDMSDDQQDITRGKGMVDSLFQAPQDVGTHFAVMSSYEYISTGLKTYNLDNNMGGFYIAPAFMDKLVVHITKNFMTLPNIKVPLILGVWGGKGQGKSFQCELVFAKMGITPIMMSAGELESGNAGEPAKLIRQRYREAADIIKKGKMCCLFINDLDAGAGRMGGTTQYTVNNQMVNATLMNIAVCIGIFRTDNVADEDIVKLVDTFPGQSIDFFGALRARVYDDEVRKWIGEVGVETIGKKLVNSREGPPTFEQPKMTIEKLLEYGFMLVQEQENVKRVQLAETYLDSAALGDANKDAMETGKFFADKKE